MALEVPAYRKHVGGVLVSRWNKSTTNPADAAQTTDYDIQAFARKNVVVTSTCNQTIDYTISGSPDENFDELVTISSGTIAAGNVAKQTLTVPFTDNWHFLRVVLDPAAAATGALELFVNAQQP